MQQAAVLFGPIVEVRDVLESFLQDGVRVADWRQRLSDASRQFVELGHRADGDPQLISLGRRIAELAGSELGTNPLTTALAGDIADLLDEVRVPGLPQPEDDDWTF
jgi:hypothetical protein